MITAERYKTATGVDPIQDDLERCNCPFAGETGHGDCGWDEVNNKSCFWAGAIKKPKKLR